MKRFIVVAFLLTLSLFLGGCFNTKTVLKIEDYFPIKADQYYEYEGIGNEFATYDVYIDYTSQTKVQKRKNNGGTVAVEVLEMKDKAITRTFFMGETYYVYNYLDQTNTNEIMLKEPLEKGNTWDITNGQRSITDIDVEIVTPFGTYNAIEVTTTLENSIMKDYYAKEVGHIKSIFNPGNDEITSTLKNITTKENKVTLNFYYPSDTAVFYKSKNITYKTNDNIITLLENEYKKDLNDLKSPLSTNSKINSIKFDNDVLSLDMSSEFLTEMNAGAGYEALLLRSFVNTFGQYFQKNKVMITIDDKTYESGHIVIEEPLEVNLTNVKEVK